MSEKGYFLTRLLRLKREYVKSEIFFVKSCIYSGIIAVVSILFFNFEYAEAMLFVWVAISCAFLNFLIATIRLRRDKKLFDMDCDDNIKMTQHLKWDSQEKIVKNISFLLFGLLLFSTSLTLICMFFSGVFVKNYMQWSLIFMLMIATMIGLFLFVKIAKKKWNDLKLEIRYYKSIRGKADVLTRENIR